MFKVGQQVTYNDVVGEVLAIEQDNCTKQRLGTNDVSRKLIQVLLSNHQHAPSWIPADMLKVV